MKKHFKTFTSFLLIVCLTFSILSFSPKANAQDNILSSSSIYYISDNFIYDVTEDTTVDNFIKNINSSPSVYTANGVLAKNDDIISTGYFFTMNDVKYTVIISGDVDCNGRIDSTDYLRIKSYFLEKFDFDETSFKASDIDDSLSIDSSDYLKIKSAFLGSYVLSSSKKYETRKKIVANLLSGAEKLSALKEIDADLKFVAISDTENINFTGKLKAKNLSTENTNFSFQLLADTTGFSYSLSDVNYINGVLYSQNGDKKYKAEASYAKVSEFLSSYLAISPVDKSGEFIIVPHVDRNKTLGEEYKTLSSYLDTVSSEITEKGEDFFYRTYNIANMELFYSMYKGTTGSDNFGDINIRDVFQSIIADGQISTNENGVAYMSKITVEATLYDEAIERLGFGTPKNMSFVFETIYNLDAPVSLTKPDESQYISVDSIYTPFAFTAYDKVFEGASAVSSTYSEKLTVNDKATIINAITNVKNIESGVELYKNIITEKSGKTELSQLYIGDMQYISKIGDSKTVTDLNTENLSVEKTSSFSYPHLGALSNIENLTSYSLIENENDYTFTYSLTKEAAIYILKNMSASSDDFNTNNYSNADYTLINAFGKITFANKTFEVITDSIEIDFKLSDGKIVTYKYSFEINTTDSSKVTIDKSLLN